MGKRDDTVKQDGVGKPDDIGKWDDMGKPDDMGKRDDTVKQDDIGRRWYEQAMVWAGRMVNGMSMRKRC
ncbi:hypothetical protein OCU04_009807 [Sclerotinia nivalis]|uniref:Uncharacterized protein n=1 Tax=Sclerotinia nivalis TaxID=352851 RepID=A0A9X0DFW4_9HELO|nr:hypothetical protein OCU04_009807 [Sclerotinia nivalis]